MALDQVGAIDPGNRVEILQNGAYFDRLMREIAGAKTSIHIETYIWWTGDICIEVATALAESARRGVEVRLMIDYSGASRMDQKLVVSMREAGCGVRGQTLKVRRTGTL